MRMRSGRSRVTPGPRVLSALFAAVLLFALPSPVTVVGASRQPPTQQDEFVPIDELPPQDQLPAAPLLVGAYALFWLIVMGYLWTIRNRLSTVEREIRDLSSRTGSEE